MSVFIMQRLNFAERRMRELLRLNSGNLMEANEPDRQQLIQEFFFHLVGTIEELAQVVNEKRNTGIPSEYVSIDRVARKLPSGDPLVPKLLALYKKTRGQPLPSDPYGDDGYMFRIYNYRNQVAHRGRNPWNFNVSIGSGGPASITLQLDPRAKNRVGSAKPVQEELERMLTLIKARISEVKALLP